MQQNNLEQFVGGWLFNAVTSKLVAAVLGILLVTVLVRFVKRHLGRRITDKDTRYRTRKVISAFGYLSALLVLVVIFSDKLGGLTIALGVAGAGIAFALQEVIASFAGWFAIVFARFYKTGDRVQLGGIKGDVVDIGVLRTTIMEVGQWVAGDLYNGRVVRVANSFVFKEPVFNYSGDFPFLWDEIVVPVKYGSDFRLARQIFEKAVNELLLDYSTKAAAAWKKMVEVYLIENAQLTPMVTMKANENWLAFTVRYVVDYKRRRVTEDQLFTRILEEIERTEGRVAIAGAALSEKRKSK